jgi:CBS-domain-containing membrane protein
MLARIIARWGATYRPDVVGCIWMAVLLGALVWLELRHGGIFLVPPFAATMSILLYLPNVSIAQPIAIIIGSTLGAAIGTVLSLILGFGPVTAMVAALTALIILPLLRVYHPPGVALAMYPALLHPGLWFAVQTVLPFQLVAVVSAALMSQVLFGWPQYPAPLLSDTGRTRS